MSKIMRLPVSAGASVLLLMAAVFSSFGAGAISGPRHFLKDQVPPAVAMLQAIENFPATNQLQLAICLPLRNQAGLDDLLKRIYDPASPSYHQYLTPQQFTEQFGPTISDYQAVINFAERNGLKVTGTHPGRVVLDVTGPVPEIENTFQVKLHVYNHPKENRTFYAPDTEPSVDASLTVPLLSISGLDNYSLPHPASLHVTPPDQGAGPTPNAGSGPGSTFLGRDFRLAYVPGTTLNGTGQSVALVQFDSYYASDITAYATLANLPPVTLTNVAVPVNSVIGAPGANNIEVALDIEMAMSMATNLSKIYLYIGQNGAPWPTMLSQIADDNLAQQISCSWGGGSVNPNAAAEVFFQQMAAQGQSFFCASGDGDAYAGAAAFPDDSTNITMVGGTTLTTASRSGTRVSETAWNRNNGVGTGGGISTYFAIPPWQQGINSFSTNGGSVTARNVPDVALTAENVYVKYGNGQGGSVGGTSCASPLWAGFMALVNQQAAAIGKPPAGFINPTVYEIANESIYSLVFNDITNGNNTSTTSPNAYYAVPGYDLCTGLGTPKGINLINALASPDPLIVVSNAGFSATGTPVGTFDVSSQIFYLTNAGTSPLVWSLINTSAWLNVSNGGGTLAAGGGDSVVVSLNTVASNLMAGKYTASLSFSNVTGHVGHFRNFVLKTSDLLGILPPTTLTFAGPPGGPFAPATQVIILTNPSPGTLNWGINNTSAWFNVSPAGGSIPPGSPTVVTFTPVAAALNLPDGIYSTTFQITNLASLVVQTVTGVVSVGIVQNGGFETGDFTSWTLVGNTNGNGTIYNGVAGTNTFNDGSGANFIHSGSYGAFLGDTNPATLSQTIQTVPGQMYLLSFWLDNPVTGSGQQFSVSWNTNSPANNQIYYITNPPVIPSTGWTNLIFVVQATDTNTTLQFGAENPPDGFGLDDVSVTAILPPVFTGQPTNLTLLAGSTAVFSATVTGSAPLAYQWDENGVSLANGAGISGATAASLTLTGITAGNAADYILVVTNLYGSATSSVATLAVLVPPVITTALTNQTIQCGGNATFTVNVSAGAQPLSYQWNLDGVPVPDATTNSLALANVHLPSHTVSVTVTNIYGSASNTVLLTVLDTLPPVMALNGTSPYYVELGSTFYDPGATANDACAGPVEIAVSGEVIPNVVGTNLITYTSTDGNGNSNTITRSVIVRDTTPPTITWSFTNLVLAADTDCAAAMPDVTGTNFIQATDLSGALTISQNPTNGYILALGTNVVVITVADASGNTAYSTNAIVVQDETSPVILSQPQSQTNVAGTTANFSVAATACTSLAYQWFFSSVALANQTNLSLAISPVDFTNAGNYSVTVTAAGGSTNSAVVVLAVINPPPNITSESANNDGSFTLDLAGTPGVSYVLESTTNLTSVVIWLPIATNTLGVSGIWQFNDTSATNFPQQFYRLRAAQ